MKMFVHVVFTYFLLFALQVNGRTVTEEQNLRTALFTGYSADVRPNDTVDVELMFVPLSLNELSIGDQLMSVTGILLFAWSDYRLAWDPASYGNVTILRTPSANVWTPVVIVENEINNVGRVGWDVGTIVRIYEDGRIRWPVSIMMTTTCDVKIAQFPYDTQECSIIITSIGNMMSEVALNSSFILQTYFTENGEWELLGTTQTEGFFQGADGAYERKYFHFRFRRRWQFYGVNLLLPLILTSILMCGVFALPIESGEKMGFSLTVLLSYVVFLTWVTDNLPAVSTDTSAIQVYLAVVLCLGVLATLLTLWVLHLYHRDPNRPLPPSVRSFAAKILIPFWEFKFCQTSTKIDAFEVEKDEEKGKIETARSGKASLTENKFSSKQDGMPPQLFLSAKPEAKTEGENVTWQEVAMMFDWLFLWIFSVAMVILSVIIILVLNSTYF